MKFQVYELQLESKAFRLYDVIDVPSQLRIIYPQGDTPVILANADGYDFLESVLKIASVSMKENCIIRIKDNSPPVEKFHEWYPTSTEFHLDLIISNFQYTQASSKKVSQMIKMIKYKKYETIDITVPKVTYNHENWWNLRGALHVNKRKSCLMVSSNRLGFLYMAKEASYFHDIKDDEDEYFEHTHLFGFYQHKDMLDMRYYFEKTDLFSKEKS
ncbi:hypothetical protein EZV73_01820 [Acidaminobacter sp. JC074]|uniref:hypothetical protein n=1 Tax=Acidaminobacter sp. JC074 TaxID=2530199 RepID=UPI001F0D818E|nr:hypothetical protein [Acidaminobacter sp. JC074]MCH4886283.1 hypothetical protein [Acidaminobacter sp. JC074]